MFSFRFRTITSGNNYNVTKSIIKDGTTIDRSIKVNISAIYYNFGPFRPPDWSVIGQDRLKLSTRFSYWYKMARDDLKGD